MTGHSRRVNFVGAKVTAAVALSGAKCATKPARSVRRDGPPELADAVERSYERDELPDWELVFELSRRALSGQASGAAQQVVGAARPA
jgi:hypothetical protein